MGIGAVSDPTPIWKASTTTAFGGPFGSRKCSVMVLGLKCIMMSLLSIVEHASKASFLHTTMHGFRVGLCCAVRRAMPAWVAVVYATPVVSGIISLRSKRGAGSPLTKNTSSSARIMSYSCGSPLPFPAPLGTDPADDEKLGLAALLRFLRPRFELDFCILPRTMTSASMSF